MESTIVYCTHLDRAISQFRSNAGIMIINNVISITSNTSINHDIIFFCIFQDPSQLFIT